MQVKTRSDNLERLTSLAVSIALLLAFAAEFTALYAPTDIRSQILIGVAYLANIISFVLKIVDSTPLRSFVVRAARVSEQPAPRNPPKSTPAPTSRMRRYQRITPLETATTLDINGRKSAAEIIDVSLSGVALRSRARLAVGQIVKIGSRQAKVMRLFPDGAGFDFLIYLDELKFNNKIVL